MYLSREERLNQIRKNPEISVLIVGGGINGIGCFWDLALQGVDVLLVERGDYCSGASAASSHMVHGGIRYLENGEFRLVREAVRERNRLIANAPHLVKPLPTTFPVFKWLSGLWNAPFKFLGLQDKPAERGAVVIKLGMMIYDWFTGKQRVVPPHVFRGRKASLKMFPRLNPKVIFTGTYYDGSMLSPERIALEVLFDAMSANPRAIALNYLSAVGREGEAVLLRDELSGEQFRIVPRLVINAAGPWIDLVDERMSTKTQFIGGTKGSHLVLNHPELRQAIGEHEFFFENKDGRIVLIFPLGERVLVGTSDIRIENPDDARVTEEEIDYFLEMVKRVFPDIEVNRSHIVFTFSGVRPLPYSDASFTGQISRDHKIEVVPPAGDRPFPIFALVGGKWTTFRAFAEQTADRVLSTLNLPRLRTTRDLPIGGGKDYPRSEEDMAAYLSRLSEEFDVPLEMTRGMFERHGTLARVLLEQSKDLPNRTLQHYPWLSERELYYIATCEDVVHLDDIVFRRTLIGMFGLLTPQGLAEIAEHVAKWLGWDEPRKLAEIRRVEQLLRDKHRMDYSKYIEETEQ